MTQRCPRHSRAYVTEGMNCQEEEAKRRCDMKKMRFVLLFDMRKFVSLSLAPVFPIYRHLNLPCPAVNMNTNILSYLSCEILQCEQQQLLYEVDETKFQLQISEFNFNWAA